MAHLDFLHLFVLETIETKQQRCYMPEGAEVRIISEGLSQKVGLRKIVNIVPISGRYTKSQIPGLEMIREKIQSDGAVKVTGIGVKGKLIFWMLSNEMFLLNTLGMTGTWSKDRNHKHARVRFDFNEGEPIFFVDTRNFGTIKIIKGKRKFLEKLQSLGPDMLNDSVSFEKFSSSLDKKPHWTVAKSLMTQSVVSGVGNYVKAESLYRAKISPHRLVGSLSTKEISDLHTAVRDVLRQAYNSRGASLKDYKDTDGLEGSASLEFMVYGLKKDPFGHKVIKEKTDDGRTTHWVPDVQK